MTETPAPSLRSDQKQATRSYHAGKHETHARVMRQRAKKDTIPGYSCCPDAGYTDCK